MTISPESSARSAVASGVVVTGGASGIGFASAGALAEAGRPVAIWDLGDERVSAAAEKIEATGGSVVGLVVDVTDEATVALAIAASREAMGSIGGLVHSAGSIIPEPIDQVDWSHWSSQIDVHLSAYARLVQALLPDLHRNPGAAVVGISSINALIGNEANPAYCAAKAGMLGLNRSLTARLGRDGIRVNAICPGYIDTPMMSGALDSGARGRFESAASLQRMGQPDEIGTVARFLLSDDASFLTGQAIAVDGGVTTTV